MAFQVGVDIGGTCTDCVVVDEAGKTTLAKVFSTPDDLTEGILRAVEAAAGQNGLSLRELLSATDLFLHSTTIAENAIVDGAMALTGLITSRGFAATLWAMRGGYGRWSGLSEEQKRNPLDSEKPAPLVPLTLVCELDERVTRDGRTLQSPTDSEIAAAGKSLVDRGAQAIAVGFLWSFQAPESEVRAAGLLRKLHPGVYVAASTEVSPMIGEYERFSTAAISAAVGPLVSEYLARLEKRLRDDGLSGTLLIMQAYGGLTDVNGARERPAALIESGPVSGLIGCARLGERLGAANIISADMGGTTFKVGTVRSGSVDYQRESTVVRYHLSLPKVDVASLGLAGGSIVSLDEDAPLPRIGPNSAGSYPGPACYCNGGSEPTVTDADAILGYLNPKYFLAGTARLDPERSRRAYEPIATGMGLAVEAAAAAVYRLTNGLIYDFLHKTTVQRGLDPREYLLFSTGGTAGMHLPLVGQQLGVAGVVVPHSASVQGAFGLVTSDIVSEEMVTRPQPFPGDVTAAATTLADLTKRGMLRLHGHRQSKSGSRVRWMIDMRFRRQVHIISVPIFSGLVDEAPEIDQPLLEEGVHRFEQMYEERYGAGSAFREAGVEFVAYRARVWIEVQSVTEQDEGERLPTSTAAPHLVGRAWAPGRDTFEEMDCYDFSLLPIGATLSGPAIIWTPITTVVLAAGQTAAVDAMRNLRITWPLS